MSYSGLGMCNGPQASPDALQTSMPVTDTASMTDTAYSSEALADDALFQQFFESLDTDMNGSINPAELSNFFEDFMSSKMDNSLSSNVPMCHSAGMTLPQGSSNTQASDNGVQETNLYAPTQSQSGQFEGSRQTVGDLRPWDTNSSGHIMNATHGALLNTVEQDDIAATINANGGSMPSSIDGIINSLDRIGAYNQGQSPEQKVAGAYLTLNTLGKMETLPPGVLGNENNASAVYGALKVAAVNGDGAQVRSLLEANGGDALGLSDQQLVDLWDVNEHDHLHAILFGNPQVYNPIHMTSLNDQDMWGQIPGANGALGGFNDVGEYPQWGWYEDALSFQGLF